MIRDLFKRKRPRVAGTATIRNRIRSRHSVLGRLPFWALALGISVGGLDAADEQLVGDPIRVPLTACRFADRKEDMSAFRSASAHIFEALKEKPSAEIKSEPPLRQASYFRLKIGGRDLLAILDLAKGGNAASLYVDTEGTGEFAKIKPFEGADFYKGRNSRAAIFRFSPITLPKSEQVIAAPLEALVNCLVVKEDTEGPKQIRAFPVKFITGELRIGASVYTVAFLDGLLAGRYQAVKLDKEPVEWPMQRVWRDNASVMAIDLNHSGIFDYQGEISPLVELVRIEDRYFRIHVEPDGSEAQFQEIKPELGVLETRCPDFEAFAISDRCAAQLQANGQGRWELPVGTYGFQSHRLRRPELAASWTLDGAGCPEAFKAIEVRRGQARVLEVGWPLELKYSAKREKDEISLAMEFTGKAGESYEAGAYRRVSVSEAVREPEPQFSVFNRAGKKLTEGKFEYG